MDTKAYIDQLAKRIKDASDAYYNGLPPLMTDAAWDALADELRRLDHAHPVLKAVGAPIPTGPLAGGGWPKVKHTIPMSSLNKSNTMGDIRAWYAGCAAPKGTFVVTDKCDGMSAGLRYENRRLVQVLTRGDGETGEDITKNALLMQGMVKMLPPTIGGVPTPANVFVRGEIVVTLTDFAKHFQGESNPRNTAAGTAKRQSDPTKCAYLTLLAYQCLPNGVSMGSKADEIRALQQIGFLVPNWSVASNLDDLERCYLSYVTTTRKSLNYWIDGLVIDINDTTTREGLGNMNNRPRGSTAWKFPFEEKTTTIKGVRWQIGKSGRLTPVAEFDAVDLGGANVKQASLHNTSNIASLVADARPGQATLWEGDKIVVVKANDVIPQVQAVIGGGDSTKPLAVPTRCPVCEAPVQMDGAYLVCRNDDCEAQAAGSIKRWLTKVGVLHFGDALVEALLEAGFVEDIADLYLLDVDKVADLEIGGRRVGGTADKAITNLNNKKTMNLSTFVGSLGISPLIGRTMVKIIEDAGYNSLSKMAKAKIADVATIPGVGQTKAEAFVLGFQSKMGLMGKLIGDAGIVISVATGSLVGKTMCQTGFRDAAMVDAFEKQGGTVKSSVSKGLTYLVALDPHGNSTKLAAAKKNGTKVIGVDDMWIILGGKV